MAVDEGRDQIIGGADDLIRMIMVMSETGSAPSGILYVSSAAPAGAM